MQSLDPEVKVRVPILPGMIEQSVLSVVQMSAVVYCVSAVHCLVQVCSLVLEVTLWDQVVLAMSERSTPNQMQMSVVID